MVFKTTVFQIITIIGIFSQTFVEMQVSKRWMTLNVKERGESKKERGMGRSEITATLQTERTP